jgi:hypothetical protein
MRLYQRVIDGRLAQVIAPVFDASGNEIPLEMRFPADVLAQIVVQDASVEPPAPSVQERIASLQAAVQMHLDAQARALGYDDLKTAATYAEEPAVPRFQEEGRALRAWRSAVWAACYGLLGQWQAGDLVEPTASELIEQMPAFELLPPAPPAPEPDAETDPPIDGQDNP